VDYGVGAIATAPPGLWIKDSTFPLWRLIKPISEYPAAIRVAPSGVMAMALNISPGGTTLREGPAVFEPRSMDVTV
jgi:hypothetical protein